jgi:hypothetical protein
MIRIKVKIHGKETEITITDNPTYNKPMWSQINETLSIIIEGFKPKEE